MWLFSRKDEEQEPQMDSPQQYEVHAGTSSTDMLTSYDYETGVNADQPDRSDSGKGSPNLVRHYERLVVEALQQAEHYRTHNAQEEVAAWQQARKR